MTEEEKVEKAHDISKADPDYKIKVSEVLTRRFEEEKRKSIEREKEKMDAGRKKESVVDKVNPLPENAANNVDKNKPIELKDPEEFVKRKDIAALVGQLNNSFTIIEKFRLRTEKILSKIERSFKDEE